MAVSVDSLMAKASAGASSAASKGSSGSSQAVSQAMSQMSKAEALAKSEKKQETSYDIKDLAAIMQTLQDNSNRLDSLIGMVPPGGAS